MTILSNTAEGGTNAATVTTANSGGTSGTVFDQVTAGVTFSALQAVHGSLAMTMSAASIQYVRWNPTATKVLLRGYFRLASPTTNHTLLRVGLSTGSISIALSSGGTLGRMWLQNGGSVVVASSNATVLSAETVYRLELYVDTTAGEIRAAAYVGDSTTAYWDTGVPSGATAGLTLAGITQVVAGKYDTFGQRVDIDSVGAKTDTDAVWGAWPLANAAPTGSITAAQDVAAAAAVTATVTASDPDGSIASYAWSVVTAGSTSTPTLTNGTTATVSLTAPAAGNLVRLQCVVTDNGGATLTLFTEVRVPLAGSAAAVPLALNGTGSGTWTVAGGSASDGAALADASDTTYLESPTLTVVETSKRVRWQPTGARSSSLMKHRLWTDTGTATATIRLYEGATLRQTWTQALTSTPTEYTFTLAGGTVSAITSWGNLFVEVAGVS